MTKERFYMVQFKYLKTTLNTLKDINHVPKCKHVVHYTLLEYKMANGRSSLKIVSIFDSQFHCELTKVLTGKKNFTTYIVRHPYNIA